MGFPWKKSLKIRRCGPSSVILFLVVLCMGGRHNFNNVLVQAQQDNAQATLQNCAIWINQADANSNLQLEESEFEELVQVGLDACLSELVQSIFYNFACPNCEEPINDPQCCPRGDPSTVVPLFSRFTFCAVLSSAIATSCPEEVPTPLPTRSPTKAPTPLPTRSPTPNPTKSPTPNPTRSPTPAPTKRPTPLPTRRPTPNPTKLPTPSPVTNPPTESQPTSPTPTPTAPTTKSPTPNPTTSSPTRHPTLFPTMTPSSSLEPTNSPTEVPSLMPSPYPRNDQSVVYKFQMQVATTAVVTLDEETLRQTLLPLLVVGLDALAMEASLGGGEMMMNNDNNDNDNNSTTTESNQQHRSPSFSVELPVLIEEFTTANSGCASSTSAANQDEEDLAANETSQGNETSPSPQPFVCTTGFTGTMTIKLLNISQPELKDFAMTLDEIVTENNEAFLWTIQGLLPAEIVLQEFQLLERVDQPIEEEEDGDGDGGTTGENIPTMPPTMQSTEEEEGVSTGVIIGVACAAGGVFLMILLCCCCFDRLECCSYRIECCFYDDESSDGGGDYDELSSHASSSQDGMNTKEIVMLPQEGTGDTIANLSTLETVKEEGEEEGADPAAEELQKEGGQEQPLKTMSVDVCAMVQLPKNLSSGEYAASSYPPSKEQGDVSPVPVKTNLHVFEDQDDEDEIELQADSYQASTNEEDGSQGQTFDPRFNPYPLPADARAIHPLPANFPSLPFGYPGGTLPQYAPQPGGEPQQEQQQQEQRQDDTGPKDPLPADRRNQFQEPKKLGYHANYDSNSNPQIWLEQVETAKKEPNSKLQGRPEATTYGGVFYGSDPIRKEEETGHLNDGTEAAMATHRMIEI